MPIGGACSTPINVIAYTYLIIIITAQEGWLIQRLYNKKNSQEHVKKLITDH